MRAVWVSRLDYLDFCPMAKTVNERLDCIRTGDGSVHALFAESRRRQHAIMWCAAELTGEYALTVGAVTCEACRAATRSRRMPWRVCR